MEQQDAVLSYNMELKDIAKIVIDKQGNEITKYIEPDRERFNQAAYMESFEDTKKALRDGFGCRVKGFFKVNEVPGIIRLSA